MNFRVVAKNGQHAFRLRRRDRIEVRTSPNPAKIGPEGSQNLGFDSRSFFFGFRALFGSILETKMAQKCHENRSRNRARQKNGKKCEKVIWASIWGQSGGMSGPGRQSLGRQDGGSALGKSQICK